MTSKKFAIGLCQFFAGPDKAANLSTAKENIAKAVQQGAQLVTLPECFNSPYSTDQFRKYSETIPKEKEAPNRDTQPTSHFLTSIAKEHGIFLVGGSFPELDDNKVYNTCLVINPNGEIIAKHRKVHLFDISVPGGITFRESDTLSSGNSATTFDTPWCKIGVGICYDLRFPELALLLRQAGCEMLIYPGAFNTTTGPPHWKLLQRGRALDMQCYVATASPSRNVKPEGYQAYGHSMVVDPWGTVLQEADEKPAVIVQEIDLNKVKSVRESIPTSKQKREDLYNLVSLKV
eukprot:augustus_masked-scaffold_5-processed-gene-16.21-mRNA-1 protein AED:0.04 eAED:0.04 QI:0/-1/0/1/-1/1/1/0/289